MLFPGQVVMPDEVEMLARVCRTSCEERGIPLSSPQARTLASHVLKLFMNGLTCEEELLSVERNRMNRQVHIDALKQASAHQYVGADR